MRYLAQSSSNDPIQTCHPQLLPDLDRILPISIIADLCQISYGRSPNLSGFGRLYPNGMTQEFMDTTYWTSSDNNLHSISNRKRLRKDFREVPSIKPSTDHSAPQQEDIYRGYKTETKIAHLEGSKALKKLASFSEGQVKQGRTKRLAATDLEESCPGVSRTFGIKRQRQTSSAGLEYAQRETHKPAPAFSYPSRSSSDNILSDFSCPLGVGWSPLSSSDPDVQAAVRGWVRFIENHYPITDVKIRLQSKGLACTLVQAAEGYYLFGDDLKQCRLVSTNPQKVWTNLQGPIPIFESEIVLTADKNSKVTAQHDAVNSVNRVISSNDMSYNPMNNPTGFGDNITSGCDVRMEVC